MTRMYTKVVVSKRNDDDMPEVSDFRKIEALRHLYFGLSEGWMGVERGRWWQMRQ